MGLVGVADFGATTVADTMRDSYGWDMVVHRWDLGRAVGQDVAWSDAECDFVGVELEGFGDQLYGEGICKPAIATPTDADSQTRVLALLGRRASHPSGSVLGRAAHPEQPRRWGHGPSHPGSR